MGSLYLSAVALILVGIGLYHIVFEPVDEEISTRVLLKENSTELPVFAHRGGAHDAPENTIIAFREAKKNGADGVEFDLSFTKDNIAVLFHDDTLERTTDGCGKLSSIVFSELRKLDAAANHIYSDRFKGEKVPTLEEGIEECLKLDLKIIFDVKEYDNRLKGRSVMGQRSMGGDLTVVRRDPTGISMAPLLNGDRIYWFHWGSSVALHEAGVNVTSDPRSLRAVAVVRDMFSKHKELYDKALVASFFPTFIYQLRRVDPNITTALTWRPRFLSYDDIPNGRPRFKSSWKMALAAVGDSLLEWAIHNVLWYITGVSAVLIHKDCLCPEYVRMWKSRGVHVIAWTPNHSLEKEYLTKSLKVSLISDTLL